MAGAATLGILLAGCTGSDAPESGVSPTETPAVTVTEPAPAESEQALEAPDLKLPDQFKTEIVRDVYTEPNLALTFYAQAKKDVPYSALVRCVATESENPPTARYDVRIASSLVPIDTYSVKCDGNVVITELGLFQDENTITDFSDMPDGIVGAYTILLPTEDAEAAAATL